jgi:hypothetical protein
MRTLATFRLRWCPAILLPLVFFCLGLTVLQQPGLEDDEVLFAAPILHLPAAIFSTQVFHKQLPLMLLPYLGALKSWLYFPIFESAGPSVLAVRIPVLIIGTLTMFLFVWLLKTTSGAAAAWVGGALLATDTMFLFTTCFDWGPVALQHFLAMAGLALLWKFAESGSQWALGLGFFSFGLALWDKALFVWLFAGLITATILVFPRELWARCTPRNLGMAAAGLFLGSLPLLIYNAVSNLATFRSNASFNLAQLPTRLHALRITWDGQILWGYMVHAPWSPGSAREAGTALGRLSGVVHSMAGFRYHNELEPAFWLALALAPLLWFTSSRKTLLFVLIAMLVAWFQMAVTKDAGLGAHHVVLLWPLPHWFVAVALVEASRWKPLAWRRAGLVALTAVTIFLVGENLLLTNEYFYQLSRYGALGNWSDAIYKLSEEIGRMEPARVVVDDWGIANGLELLRGGSLSLLRSEDWNGGRFANDLWIGHAGKGGSIVKESRAAGFEKQLIQTVADRNGRPVFEIFRFARASS